MMKVPCRLVCSLDERERERRKGERGRERERRGER